MSRFQGRFQFEAFKAEIASDRNKVRRIVGGWLAKSGRRYYNLGLFKIDLLVEFENELSKLTDAALHEYIEDVKKALA